MSLPRIKLKLFDKLCKFHKNIPRVWLFALVIALCFISSVEIICWISLNICLNNMNKKQHWKMMHYHLKRTNIDSDICGLSYHLEESLPYKLSWDSSIYAACGILPYPFILLHHCTTYVSQLHLHILSDAAALLWQTRKWPPILHIEP